MATRLDKDTSKPSTVEPGDAPADTTDPTEHASTVGANEEAAAAAGHLTANAVVPVPAPAPAKREGKDRIEKYPATRPDGTEVTVTHNIDTGETKVS